MRNPLQARVPQTQVGALYDRLSGVYDLWGHLTESRARRRSLELADVRDGENLLEVAVGTGLAFAELVARNPNGRNLGIDISRGMLSKARRRLQERGLSNCEILLASALEIPAVSGSFDVVMNSYMFDLMSEEDWAVALREFHRVLRADGRLVLVDMTVGEGWGTGIYDRLYGISPALMGGCRGIRLADTLARTGFSVRLREYFQQMLFPSEVILASKSAG